MAIFLSLAGLMVHDDGSIERYTRRGWVNATIRTRKDGYQTFKHRGRTLYVHRVVCEAHRGPPPTPDAEAHHGDNNRSHNAESNLSWLTPAANKARRHYPNRRTRPPRTEPTHPELKRLHGEPR